MPTKLRLARYFDFLLINSHNALMSISFVCVIVLLFVIIISERQRLMYIEIDSYDQLNVGAGVGDKKCRSPYFS